MEQKQKAQTQRAKQDRIDALSNLKRLRRDGVLTRQQYRLLVADKGLDTGVKGSPLYTAYETVKGQKGAVPVVKQWTRF